MTHKRGGQAALEFLVTYGWAILGVLIVIGALAYFGVFNATKYVNDVCEFGDQMKCEDFIINKSSLVSFQLRNNFGVPIDITRVKIKSDYGISLCPAATSVFPPTINPGFLFEVRCNISGRSLTPGDKVRVSGTIEFRKSNGGLPGNNPLHNQTGSIFSTVSPN